MVLAGTKLRLARSAGRGISGCELGEAMDAVLFKVAFLDACGALIEVESILGGTVTSAAQRAGEIATEIDAANFVITAATAKGLDSVEISGQRTG